MSLEQMTETIRRQVTCAGGVYIGIQKSIVPGEDLVVFTAPMTGVTLMIRLEQCSILAVTEKIREHEALFAKRTVKILAEAFQDIVDTLRDIVTILESKIQEKK